MPPLTMTPSTPVSYSPTTLSIQSPAIECCCLTVLNYSVVKSHSTGWNRFIVYNIQIRGQDGTLSTRFIQKRFRDFKTLYKTLCMEFPQLENQMDIFKQNSLSTYSKRFEIELLNDRLNCLQMFLQCIDQDKAMRYHPAVSQFLDSSTATGL